VQPNLAAACPSPRSPEPSPTLERHVGELVAAAASAVAEGMREKFQRGSLTASTKTAGGDLIFELYKLRTFMVGYWPFDDIARKHGTAVLLEASGSDISPASADDLVTAVMNILHKVVRKAAN